MVKATAWIGLVLVVVAAGDAHAEFGIPYELYDREHWPPLPTQRALTLPRGMVEVGSDAAFYASDTSLDAPGNFVTISPHARYGLTPLLTVGLAQSTVIFTSPDYAMAHFNLDGIFKFAGPHDIAAHVQLPVHHFAGFDAGPIRIEGRTAIDLRIGLEGRLVFSNELGNVRFRAGLIEQSLNAESQTIPDLDVSVLYQMGPFFALGIRNGLTAMDWTVGDPSNMYIPLQMIGIFNIDRSVDIMLNAGLIARVSGEAGAESIFILSAGISYRI